MKRRPIHIAITGAIAIGLSLAACSASPPGEEPATDGEYVPEWVDGVLQPTPGGFPSGTITITQPTGPDEGLVLRHLQPVIEEISGMSVRVVDRPDFNSSVPDHLYDIMSERPATRGYIVTIGSQSGVLSRLLTTPVTQDLGLDLDSFIGMQIEETPYLITARADAPFDNLEEMVEYAKDHPGELRNLSRPPGTATSLALDYYLDAFGVDVEKVVGGSQDELAVALGAGEGDIMINLSAVTLPHLQGDKVKLLACTGDVSPCVGPWPDLPLAKEVLGNEGVDPFKTTLTMWFATDTDPDILAWWQALIQALPDQDDYVEARENLVPGTKVTPKTAEETREAMDTYWDIAYPVLEELGTLDPSVKK